MQATAAVDDRGQERAPQVSTAALRSIVFGAMAWLKRAR